MTRLLLPLIALLLCAGCAMSHQHWGDNYAGWLDEDYNSDAIAIDPNPWGPPEAARQARLQHLHPYDRTSRMAHFGYIDPDALDVTDGAVDRTRYGHALE